MREELNSAGDFKTHSQGAALQLALARAKVEYTVAGRGTMHAAAARL